MRHVFQLMEIRKSNADDLRFVLIREAEAAVSPVRSAATTSALKSWALRVLSEEKCALGLYAAEFASIDDGGNPAGFFADSWIVWDGALEMMSA